MLQITQFPRLFEESQPLLGSPESVIRSSQHPHRQQRVGVVFAENRLLPLERLHEKIDGFLVSVDHPGSRMIGPGVTRDEDSSLALIVSQLNRYAGRQPVFLVPADRTALIGRLYEIGARNCELHFAQVLGESQPVEGIVMPSFMPESR